MEIGIIGLPFVGKTTVFNALTRGSAAVGTFTGSAVANRAVVKIPDERLDRLAEIFRPRQVVPASIEYIDVAGISKGSMERGSMDAQLLADLRNVDALAHVVRVFEAPNVPHPEGAIDPKRDIENLNLELNLADLQIVESSLARLQRELRARKDPRQEAQRELLLRCQEALESEIPLRQLEFTPEEEKALRGYQFLTRKPLIVVLNIGESQIEQQEILVASLQRDLTYETPLVPLSALLEMEIAQLDEDEATEFLAELGLTQPALRRFIEISYELLGLQTFFTGGDREVHAWTIPRGTTALDAAAKIHSDMARGFIRAEVVAFPDLDQAGSWTHARETGVLRLEGKEYVVQDGDVLLVRFNV